MSCCPECRKAPDVYGPLLYPVISFRLETLSHAEEEVAFNLRIFVAVGTMYCVFADRFSVLLTDCTLQQLQQGW